MTTKDRLITFLAYINISQGKFEKGVGLSTGFVNNVGDSIRKSTLDKISSVYPELNTAWLLTGVGNMINENKNNVERDNYGVQGNGSQNISGNMVNVTMPESGTQKIIKPTGEVEIHRLDPSDKSNSEELDRLKQRIQDLERIIAEKDATIQSKDDTIKTKDELISFLRADRQ
ncbi:hypothetical protein [Bacteroides ovatus]|jgi:hypothetical protein|uniref:hypothetical protein n=1 Tax=Bacteroides ovatus TaxID=28116 RepID=UPI0022E06856|nr:hypothetical protein [Bacteroides ovatus]